MSDETPQSGRKPRSIRRTPEIEVAIGARIRAVRLAAGITQSALGAVIGVTSQQIQKYEIGKDRIAASTLQVLATTLGVHPGSFFDDEMPEPQNPIANLRAVVKLGQHIQRVRDPATAKHLLALADVLAGVDDEQPSTSDNETP